MAEKGFYPPVSFHFLINFSGLGEKGGSVDARFQSVTGLTVNFETETIKEGGENRFQHMIPSRTQYAELVLKRGVITPQNSTVSRWCIDAFEKMVVKPTNLEIVLLNQVHEPLMTWKVIHAWPKRWAYSDLNAEQSALMIETLELHYNRFEVM